MSDQQQIDSGVPHSEPDNALGRVIQDRAFTVGQYESTTVPDILHAVREHLKMEVAFVSEFVNGQRVFRYMDSTWAGNPLHVGEGNPLEESYCQRIVDGRLPEIVPDARANPITADLPVTYVIQAGAYMGVPILLSDGSVYGTFCCFSRSADTSLTQRDVNLMRVFADLAGKMIDRERKLNESKHQIRERIEDVLHSRAFHTVYQPIYDLDRAAVAGFESLTRFTTTPMLPPDRWFSDAHAVGLGVELELLAIERALQVLPQLSEGLDLGINASPESILDPRFDALLADLAQVGQIVLEITEHAAVERYEEIAARLKPYRDRGLQIAVDDAGAGYASFRHILNLEPDRIKLDMSLTRDIDIDPARRALAAALIHFSAETGSKLVAEGVETAAEAAALVELGVERAQGYFLGRPMTLQMMQQGGHARSPAAPAAERRLAARSAG